ncbi:hypothetical protein BDU57DRAFT_532539 [Ampelomyces quisqualis]|uniref:Uncharacterized protein n=1 Tax=Ampelomyces quisqualis TaxID=50730 RepID=A0A6A5QA82_AMPQU|nr:hypothetical protein BDU57DRAFT_532539 [Ampelomyces quisqualis]
MAQRSMRPSLGALRRPLSVHVCAASGNTARALSSSARRLDDTPGDAASSAPASSAAAANPSTRRARSEIALRQITNLQNRRIQPGGLARGNFPSGQVARTTPVRAPGGVDGGDGRAASPRMAKFPARPTTAPGATPPEGRRMVRAPNTLRISRNATVGSMRGPNLGARTGARSGGKAKDAGREQTPMKRDKKAKSAPRDDAGEVDFSSTLSDGMVRNLLRLQRKEWDRVPYEPKYAPGSFAANQLIYEGRELMRGEVPPVKIWGRLEKRIGLVGMFGAEAHLKVRRVPDGDAAPFGHEEDATIPSPADPTFGTPAQLK